MNQKIQSPEMLKSIGAAYLAQQAGFTRRVLVCGGAGCVSCHCQEVKDALDASLSALDLTDQVQVLVTGCIGLCAVGPILVVEPEGVLYTNMTPERGFAARWLRLFPFPLKIHFKGRQLPAGQEFSQIFFRFCNAGNEILATGGAENFSFHSPHHRVLKFAKRNGQFSLCFLLRTKIRNAKRRGKKYSFHLLLQSEQGKMAGNGAGQQKSSKSFSDLLLSLAAPVAAGIQF